MKSLGVVLSSLVWKGITLNVHGVYSHGGFDLARMKRICGNEAPARCQEAEAVTMIAESFVFMEWMGIGLFCD
ncbi:MAG: hypothetical protein NPIRA06_28640 [Nitrospirales bacterium]|nr:MAG: hypothetical protein NPIRA06_28640 [Nitrospirales bacterium]